VPGQWGGGLTRQVTTGQNKVYFGEGNDRDDHRRGFVRKVYGILTCQLLLTFGIIFAFVFTDLKLSLCGMDEGIDNCPPEEAGGANRSAWDVPYGCNLSPNGGCILPTEDLQNYYYIAIVFYFVSFILLLCCPNLAKKVPTNYILLFLFTLSLSVMLGIMCLFQDAASVGLAAAMTAAVTFGLTLFACFTEIDFTGAGAYLVAAVWALIICGLIGAIFGGSYGIPWSQSLYAGLGCIIFSLFIVYDTQMIVGGKHKKHQFSIDDYVFAALNIYLDIINLFIYILQILDSRD
jgi:FtsH-binding integral membrane protein